MGGSYPAPFEPLRCLVLSLRGGNETARQNSVKTRRHKALTLKRRNASKALRRHDFSPASQETNVARLSRELSEAFEQQAATAEILNVISNSPTDTQPVFDAIVQSGLKLFPGALVSVALRYGDMINAAAVAAPDPARVEAWRRTISRTPLARNYMHGAALLDRRIVDIPDVGDAPAEFAAGGQNFLTSGNRAITIMPMMRGNEAIGLLSVVRRTPGPLSDKQLSLLRTFAAQAVIAIENTRLLNELRQRDRGSHRKVHNTGRPVVKAREIFGAAGLRLIFTGQQDVKIVSARKKLTVCFSDLVGFTEITDQMESEDLTQLLNQYLTEMSKIALQYGATIDKYVGDAIVMFFGDPTTLGVKQDALACVQMAIAMQQRVGELAQEWRGIGIGTPLRCRIGIHTGYCTVGNFGSEDRMDYTMVGGTVNLASRLEHEAPPGGILISFETYAHVKDEVHCEERGQVQVKGIAYPVATYAVLGRSRTPSGT